MKSYTVGGALAKTGWGALILLGAISILIMPIFTGYTLHLLWGWFVVPLGVHPIGIAHAYGLLTMVGLFKVGLASESIADDGSIASRVGVEISKAVAINLVVLGIGALAHWFM